MTLQGLLAGFQAVTRRHFVWQCFIVAMLGLASAPAAVLTFTPAADALVANKTATTNYGSLTPVTVNNNNSIRVLLVRFDLSGVTESITRLKLSFTMNSGSAPGRPVKIFGLVNGQNWSEAAVTWATAPGVVQSFTASPWEGVLADYLKPADLYQQNNAAVVLSTFTPAGGAGTATAFDVTAGAVFDFVNADADKVVTFLVAIDDPKTGGGQVFSTREAGAAAPVLTVTTVPLPAQPSPTLVTFRPVADAYVSNRNPATNFGTDPTLTVNNANGIRAALVRFDLSSINGTINGLRLDLTGTGLTIGKALNVYGLVAGENWVETGVTWANGPGVNHAWTAQTGVLADYLSPGDLYGGGTVLATFNPTTNSGPQAAFNVNGGAVLAFINADADRIVTFLIVETDASDAAGNVFSTREVPGQAPLLTVSCVPTTSAPAVIRVILLGGQSNAVGYAPSAPLPAALLAPQTEVLLYSQVADQPANADGTLGVLQTLHPGTSSILGDFGPEVTLGLQLSELFNQIPGTQLAIIKYARAGTSLSTDWKAGGNATTTGDGTVYLTFQQVVKNGLAKLAATYGTSVIRLDGMVWVQGEQDTNTTANAQAYDSRLTALIGDLRATFSATPYGATLPFFFSQISDQQTYYSDPASSRYPGYLELRQSQQNVAATVPGAYLLNTDGPSFSVNNTDFAHFDTAGQQVLGSAFAARMAEVLTLRVTGVAPATAGATVSGSGLKLTWNAIPSRSYSVQTSANLQTWNPPFSVGITGQWTDTGLAGVAARYYRVLEN